MNKKLTILQKQTEVQASATASYAKRWQTVEKKMRLDMKKIKYAENQLKQSYFLGIFFIISGIILTVVFTIYGGLEELNLDGSGIGLIGGGILALITHYYVKQKQYLTIKNGILIKNSLFPKKINLNQIRRIKKFAGDYTLITENSKLTIDTQVIDKNSLKELNSELEKLEVKWE